MGENTKLDDECIGVPQKVAYSTIAISVFCLSAMALFLPMLHYRLNAAHADIEMRMDAFRVNLEVLYDFNTRLVHGQKHLAGCDHRSE